MIVPGDSRPKEAFGRLIALAGKVLHTPVSFISLISQTRDGDRHFIKSQVGLQEQWLKERQIPSFLQAFCQHVIASGEPLVISDTHQHPLVRDNSIPDSEFAAYIGMPLTTSAGHVIGSFCVTDNRLRRWSNEEVQIFASLADLATTEVQLGMELSDLRWRMTGWHYHCFNPIFASTMGWLYTLAGLQKEQLIEILQAEDGAEFLESLSEAADLASYARERTKKFLVDTDTHLTRIENVALHLKLQELTLADVTEVLEKILKRFTSFDSQSSRKGLKLASRVDPDLPPFKADVDKLWRVVIHLLTIAVMLVPEGSTIIVSATDSSDKILFSNICIGTRHFTGEIFDRFEHVFGSGYQDSELDFCRKAVRAHGGWLETSGVEEEIRIEFAIPYRIFYSYDELEAREKENRRDGQT